MPSASILGRAARLLVTPAPTTLSDSLCILKRLQRFGPVSTFLNPRYVPALSQNSKETDSNTATLLAIFASCDSLNTAMHATPLTIETGLDAPDPREEDPYNVRGLRDRIPILSKTFKCIVLRDTDPESHHTANSGRHHHGKDIDPGRSRFDFR